MNPCVVLGIDPGLNGGMALLSWEGVRYQKMPLIGNRIDAKRLAGIFKSHPLSMVYVEAISPRPGQSAQSTSTSGINFGMLLATLELCSVPYTVVPASVWTKTVHAGIDKRHKPKEKSRIALNRLFPNEYAYLTQETKAPHEGLMDALLIAYYGRLQQGRGETNAEPA